jgi:hypothetical protein
MVTLPEAEDADAWRGPHVYAHVARAEQRGTSHRDQSVFAMRSRNWNGGTPSALHLTATCHVPGGSGSLPHCCTARGRP